MIKYFRILAVINVVAAGINLIGGNVEIAVGGLAIAMACLNAADLAGLKGL